MEATQWASAGAGPYLAARSAERAIGGYGDTVDVAGVPSEVVLQLAIGKVPDLTGVKHVAAIKWDQKGAHTKLDMWLGKYQAA